MTERIVLSEEMLLSLLTDSMTKRKMTAKRIIREAQMTAKPNDN